MRSRSLPSSLTNRPFTAEWKFTAEGYRVLRVTAAHLQQPRDLLKRVHAALVAGGYDGPEPVFTAEWSALFERVAR